MPTASQLDHADRRLEGLHRRRAPSEGRGAQPVAGSGGPPRGAPAGHVAALDGLRGLAVLAVVVYHLPATWLPGGFLGVDVFFVLSGFLITDLLLRGRSSGGGIGLRDFWLRRARRLLPAAVTVIVVTTVAASVFARDSMDRLRADVPAALLYVMNWRLIFQHDSYEQVFGRPPLLEHLWSLGVEEQFYLVWPLVVLAVAWWARRRRRDLGHQVAAVALGGAALSAVLMAALVRTGHDPSQVYFDPGTHATGLLLGAATAGLFPLRRRAATLRLGARRCLEAMAGVAGAGLVALLLTLHQADAASYRGGLQLASLCGAVIVLVAGHPGARLGRCLGRGPLLWLGQRSYSIYLWHWPIFEMTRPGIDLHLAAPLALGLRLGLTGVAAELSYRLVEQPWRSGRAGRAVRLWWGQAARPVVATAAGVIAVITASLTLLLVDAPSDATLAVSSTPASRVAVPLLAPPVRPSRPARGPVPGPQPSPRATPPLAAPPGPVLAIGDSVMLGASSALEAALGPGTVVDASVGRQVYQGIERLEQYRAAGRLAGLRAVIVGLGTNGPMTVAQCQQIVSIAGGDRVLFVTVRVPRPWQGETNASIATCAATLPDVSVVAWYQSSAAPGVLGPDQVHETPAGRALYASLVAASVNQPPPAPAGAPVAPGGRPAAR